MKRTGEILRQEREARGLSLHEIGLSLKINSKILKAIEEGDTTQLPAKTFLRGFVQSYASYLKLNVDEVLRVFAEEMGTTRPQPIITPPKEEPKAEEAPPIIVKPPVHREATPPKAASKAPNIEDSSTTKGLIFAVGAVVLAGLITITVKVIEKYQREAQVAAVDVKPIEQPEQTPAPEESMASTPLVEESPVASADQSLLPPAPVSPGATLSSPVPPVAVATPSPSPSPIASPSSTPTLAAKPTPTPSPTPTAAVAVAVKPTPTPSPSPTASPTPVVQKRSIELIIEALDNVEIEYSSGAGRTDRASLASGQIHTFKSNSGLRLSISNGGAVNVILNGKEMGVPGDLGKPIKLNY